MIRRAAQRCSGITQPCGSICTPTAPACTSALSVARLSSRVPNSSVISLYTRGRNPSRLASAPTLTLFFFFLNYPISLKLNVSRGSMLIRNIWLFEDFDIFHKDRGMFETLLYSENCSFLFCFFSISHFWYFQMIVGLYCFVANSLHMRAFFNELQLRQKFAHRVMGNSFWTLKESAENIKRWIAFVI